MNLNTPLERLEWHLKSMKDRIDQCYRRAKDAELEGQTISSERDKLQKIYDDLKQQEKIVDPQHVAKLLGLDHPA